MITVSESTNGEGAGPLVLTVGALKKALKGLPDSVIVVCEDGKFKQAAVEGVKLCTHVVVGPNVTRTFISKNEIQGYRDDNDGDIVLELTQPVLCIDTPGQFK